MRALSCSVVTAPTLLYTTEYHFITPPFFDIPDLQRSIIAVPRRGQQTAVDRDGLRVRSDVFSFDARHPGCHLARKFYQ